MNNKTLALVIIFSGLIIIAGILYLMFFYNFEPNKEPEPKIEQQAERENASQLQEAEQASNGETEVSQERVNEETPESPVAKENVTENDLKKMASSFAERFGSYSNHSDFSNISNLQIFMTDNMREWSQEFLQEKRTEEYSGTFYGITTNSLSSNIDSFDQDSGEAVVTVTTQRRETVGDKDNTNTYNQDIVIEFKKMGGAWKIDSARWEEG
jgi:hypothetical protein